MAVEPTRIETLSEDANTYFFELRNGSDDIVSTDTGAPPTTVFTDLFTGLSDGDYVLYCFTKDAYYNLTQTLNITYKPFTLVSGLIVAVFPNEVLSLSATAQAGGNVLVEWSYSSANEQVEPDSFEVYIDAVFDSSIPYVAQGSYSTTLTSLSETLKTIKVTAKAGTQETTGLSVTVTPDSTAPSAIAFNWERI